MMKKYEYFVHTLALSIAVFGPLLNLFMGLVYAVAPPGMYMYWMTCLSIYIVILLPFTYKSPLTLLRLTILGITVEDFFSHFWRSLNSGSKFLPFFNWYTQHFPFLGSLGQPMPMILIPQWYLVALFLYFIITILQFRKPFYKKLSEWDKWRRKQKEE